MERYVRDGVVPGGPTFVIEDTQIMVQVVYRIVEHDGGWAYQVDGVYSETYRSHDAARDSATRAAHEQKLPGDDVVISFEDPDGRWRQERVAGGDRPETVVEG